MEILLDIPVTNPTAYYCYFCLRGSHHFTSAHSIILVSSSLWMCPTLNGDHAQV